MPRGPTANWNRHQYKKAAMLAYAIAASAGSRGNVGKLRPAGRGQADKRASEQTVFSGSNFTSSIGVERYTPVFQIGILGAIPRCSTNFKAPEKGTQSHFLIGSAPSYICGCGTDGRNS